MLRVAVQYVRNIGSGDPEVPKIYGCQYSIDHTSIDLAQRLACAAFEQTVIRLGYKGPSIIRPKA